MTEFFYRDLRTRMGDEMELPPPWLEDMDHFEALGFAIGIRGHEENGQRYLVLVINYKGCPQCGGPVDSTHDPYEGYVTGIYCDRCEQGWGDY